MRRRLLGTRRYSVADQERFAALSGDYNPLHLDPIAARRALFGEPAVHGMHNVAWALERYFAQASPRIAPLARLSATFAKPSFLGEALRLYLVEENTDDARLLVARDSLDLVDLRLERGRDGEPDESAVEWGSPSECSRMPKSRSIEEMDGLTGVLDICCDGGLLAEMFPASCAVLGSCRVAELLSLSRLVGMECPGLHSLFSGFQVEMHRAPGRGQPMLRFAVTRVDSRFSMVRIGVEGTTLQGSVTAFLRPPPARQPDISAVASLVAPDAFSGQRALVVGGSRGLGELTAKMIAAGGGHPVITYRDGATDAGRILREINAQGGRCDSIRLDVARPQTGIPKLLPEGWLPTHLYYFATPRIFVRRSGLFDPAIFRRFLSIYVDGFLRTYQACRRASRGPLHVFYPSSVAVEEDFQELAEYAAAKAAGESLCRQIDKFERQVRVLIERLPRLPTDQTATLMAVHADDPADIMLRILLDLAAD